MGIGSSIGDAVGSKQQLDASRKELKNQRIDRERALGMAADQDVEPVYASELAPTFQRSRSPVADVFLESLITGNNASAVQGTRAGAPNAQARAQAVTNRRYGPADALLADQRAMEQATPWQPKPITRPVVTDAMRMRSKQTPGDELAAVKYDLTPEQVARLRDLGVGTTGKGVLDNRGAGSDTAEMLNDSFNAGNRRAIEDFLASGRDARGAEDLARSIRTKSYYRGNGRR